MVLVAQRLFRIMFICMEKNKNEFPDWMHQRLRNDVYNPYADVYEDNEMNRLEG